MPHELVRLAAGSNKGGGLGSLLLPLVVVVLVFFYFTTTRRRRNAAAQTQGTVRPGAEVMTTAGLFATVTGIDDDGVILLEVAPGVICRYTRGAISKVLTNGPDVAEDLDQFDADDHDEDEDAGDREDGHEAGPSLEKSPDAGTAATEPGPKELPPS